MWIFTKNGFLSVVQPTQDRKFLLVLGRVKGDIESLFPGYKVERTPKHDYLYRAWVLKTKVAEVIAAQITNIDYDNFKDTTEDEVRAYYYESIWWEMTMLQRDKASGKKIPGRLLAELEEAAKDEVEAQVPD